MGTASDRPQKTPPLDYMLVGTLTPDTLHQVTLDANRYDITVDLGWK
jgi:hypothetical protein